MKECDFQNAFILEANFSNCDMQRAKLFNANGERINFEGADLSYANMIGAVLIQSNLRNVNLNFAKLRNTDFSNSILIDAKNIETCANLTYADFNKTIVCSENHKKIKRYLSQKTMFVIKE